MTASFVRALYYGVLLLVPAAMIGVAHWAGEDGAAADTMLVSAQAADSLPPLAPGVPASKVWICPMHAHILQDHTGSCPICGMDLVEAEAPPAHATQGVQVDSALQQRMGMRLAKVSTQRLRRELHTYGNVATDETSVHIVSPKTDGWIRRLYVTTVGQRVVAGQLLYEIYSPELVQRQREYIELLQRRDQLLQNMTEMSGQNAQMAAALARERMRTREKFAYADVSEQTLARIEATRRPFNHIPVYAKRSGVVTAVGAREGGYVTPMSNLLSLADLATVSIDIVLYPDQLEWVSDGDEVSVRFPHSARTPFSGRLALATRVVDPRTRAVRARLVADNVETALRPGEFVDVVIATRPHDALAVPRSAVIRTGTGNRVMLAREGGHFMPVAVETGIENGDFVEITDGLQEGVEVAVSGQFLLDAAASMNDAAQRMHSAR